VCDSVLMSQYRSITMDKNELALYWERPSSRKAKAFRALPTATTRMPKISLGGTSTLIPPLTNGAETNSLLSRELVSIITEKDVLDGE